MTEVHPLQNLYDQEINFKVEAMWDGGFDVALGDELNGYKARGCVRTFDEAVQWLVDHAALYYPLERNNGDVVEPTEVQPRNDP